MIKLLIGVTGSVAAIKIPELIQALKDTKKYEIRIIVTNRANYFMPTKDSSPDLILNSQASVMHSMYSSIILQDNEFNSKAQQTTIVSAAVSQARDVLYYNDSDEWSNDSKSYQRGDSVLHIDLKKWADVLLIAPLSANTLGKIANGLCDNLLTCVIRAWSKFGSLILVPAMNTDMWKHPVTMQHIKAIESWGPVIFIDPVIKLLACGDFGIGAMASIDSIVKHVELAAMR